MLLTMGIVEFFTVIHTSVNTSKKNIQIVIFKSEFSCMLLASNVYTSTYSSFSYNMDYFSNQSRWALPNNEIVILKE